MIGKAVRTGTVICDLFCSTLSFIILAPAFLLGYMGRETQIIGIIILPEIYLFPA